MTGLLIVVVSVAVLALICGTILGVASKYLAVPEEPRIGEVAALLPGANCGGCGFAGCADYAKAIVEKGASCSLCAPGGSDLACAIAACMGQVAEAMERQVAMVLCGGGSSKTTRRAVYNGIADCAAAHATAGGDKGCGYGCLGYGSCMQVCPVRAVRLEDGIAVVEKALCIGCGACLKVCPRHLIKLVPASAVMHVLCSSRAKGPEVKKVCSVGCIGCRLCTKTAGESIVMEGFLAVCDYTKPIDGDAAKTTAEKCPGKCIKAG